MYRRKSGAAAHIAIHLRRLGGFGRSREVEIGQKDLGMLAGYDPRTVRIALSELAAEGCVTSPRRSLYRLDSGRLDDFIERQKAEPPPDQSPILPASTS